MSPAVGRPLAGRRAIFLYPGLAVAVALAVTLIPAACEDEKPDQGVQAPAPDEIVARIGDMVFTESELNEDFAFLKGSDPSLSDGYIRHYLLTEVLIPRRLAQRELDRQVVAEARQKAEDLVRAVTSAGGDLTKLREYGDALGGQESPFPLFRTNDMEVPAARAAFGLKLGEVSGAIHGTWGSYVLAPTSQVSGVAGSASSRKVYTVFFPYSEESGFKSRILGKALDYSKTTLEVHPYYYRELRPLATDIRILSKN